jgi:hypothetical protein
MNIWEPIKSAPKDGMFLVANGRGEVCPCQSRDGQRIVQNMPGFQDWTYGECATHWMRLPKKE